MSGTILDLESVAEKRAEASMCTAEVTEITLDRCSKELITAVTQALLDDGKLSEEISPATKLDRNIINSVVLFDTIAAFEKATSRVIQPACEAQLQLMLLSGSTVAECAALLFENPKSYKKSK